MEPGIVMVDFVDSRVLDLARWFTYQKVQQGGSRQ